MQMKHLPRSMIVPLTVAWLAMGAGCDGSRPVTPEPITVEITPSGVVDLDAGDSITLVTTVRNARDPGVTFTSSNEAVAVVRDDGTVVGMAPGLATITAASREDPDRRAAVLVRVAAISSEGKISIASVVDADGRPTATDGAAGRLKVRVQYQIGSASRVQVMLESTVVCDMSTAGIVADTAGTAEVVCEIPTDRFDPVTGEAAFPNGAVRIRARLMDSNGVVLATVSTQEYTLANRSRVVVTVVGARTAMDALGRPWHGGDVTARAVPVVYEPAGSAAVSRVTFGYVGSAGIELSRADSTAPFEVVFPAASLPVLDTTFQIGATAIRGSALPDLIGASEVIRYDAFPPVPGDLVPRPWFGAATRFSDAYDATSQGEIGVGQVDVRFYAGDPALSAEAIVAQGTEVREGADLPSSAGSSQYRLAALVCDALRNCTVLRGFTFGVDLTGPAISESSVADRAINPRQDITLVLTDSQSGVPSMALEATATRHHAGAAAVECGPLVEGRDLPGRAVQGACVADTLGGVLPVPSYAPGYYRYSVRGIDRVGNRGDPLNLSVLVDLEAPTIASTSIPSRFVGGSPTTVGAVVRDNVDLVHVDWGLVFPIDAQSRIDLPMAARAVGQPFDDVLTLRDSAAVTFPFVRSMTSVSNPSTGARTTVLVDSIRVAAVDAAGNPSRHGRVILPGDLDRTTTSDPFTAMTSSTFASSSAAACVADCAASDVTTLTLTFVATGVSGFASQFSVVYFYLLDGTGSATLVTADLNGPQVLDEGGQRSYRFSGDFNTVGLRPGFYFAFALGITAGGDSFRSAFTSVSLLD